MSEFQGFGNPEQNWSRLPHQLIEALPQIETIGEMKIIIYTLRHTWGYQDDYKKITLDEFENGRKRKNGSRIDSGTGLTKPTIINGIKRAVAHGFLFEYIDSSDPARVKKFYSLTEEGLKDLTPDVKRFNTRGKDFLHRTEKETIEKETIDISPNGENEISSSFDLPPDSSNESDQPKQLTDSEKDRLLVFGAHPDTEVNGSFDTIQEIQNTGWEIRNHVIELAIAYYLEAVRERRPDFAIPNNPSIRKDWYKAVNGHLQDYRIDDLSGLYRIAIERLNNAKMTYSRPGALTKTLPDVVDEVSGPAIDMNGGFYV